MKALMKAIQGYDETQLDIIKHIAKRFKRCGVVSIDLIKEQKQFILTNGINQLDIHFYNDHIEYDLFNIKERKRRVNNI